MFLNLLKHNSVMKLILPYHALYHPKLHKGKFFFVNVISILFDITESFKINVCYKSVKNTKKSNK